MRGRKGGKEREGEGSRVMLCPQCTEIPFEEHSRYLP